MTKTAPKSTPALAQTLEAMTSASGEVMRKSYERSVAMMTEMADISKRNFDAYAASVSATGKGLEALNQRAFQYTKEQMEASMSVARELTSAKTLKDVLETQAEFAKKSFETYVEEANAMSGLVQSMVKDAVQPINTQAGQVVAFMQRRA